MSEKNLDLSIVLPGIRRQNWRALYESAKESVGKSYSFEMIIVGPGKAPEDLIEDNFKFIEDYGAPARCAQIGVIDAKGTIMTWASDDGVFLPGALERCLDFMIGSANRKEGIIIRYREGGNFPDDSYWKAWTHADLRLPGVNKAYKIAPVGMYFTDYFKEVGGWDCRYEHLNMCCHDLAFRIQNDGGELYQSPTEVLSCTWTPHSIEQIPVMRAYHENDLPLWNEMYFKDQSLRVKIDYNNWRGSPAIWTKRFEVISNESKT